MTMKITRPVYTSVLEAAAILTSSNVAEDPAPEWVSGTIYVKGDQVKDTAQHKVYERTSYAPGNATNTPAASIASGGGNPDTAFWFEVSATNKFKMFDSSAVTQTTQAAGAIDVTLTPGGGNTLYLAGMEAQTVIVTGTVAGGVVVDRTISLTSGGIRRADLTISDLPADPAISLRVQILNPGTVAKCGTLIFGQDVYIGEVQTKPKIRIVDYSRIETNAFGVTALVQRVSTRSITYDLFVENEMFDEVCRLMGTYTGTPLLWSGGEGPDGVMYESLNLFGVLKDFGGVLDSSGGTFCDLQVLGLTNVS